MKKLTNKIAIVVLSLLVIFGLTALHTSADNAAPQVQITKGDSSKYTISATFKDEIPAGNIADIEVYSKDNQKIWQYFSPSGGTTFSGTTDTLPDGKYFVSVGLFTQNWDKTYAWFDHIATIGDVTPTPNVSTTVTTASADTTDSGPALAAAQSAYDQWKGQYVVANDNGLRVVRPENNNDTVSEGMGYGMLLSAFAKDQTTFDGLWNYTQKHLDGKGLMNWQIDANGSVIGNGSATDADEDIAYALVKANTLWPGKGYDTAAKNMIGAMKTNDVVNNYMNPGDNWGATSTINPSYLAPSYYTAFATITGDDSWNTIATQNRDFLAKAADGSTGLLPDWINADLSSANIGFDAHQHDFYYDALRTPIRLLMDYKANNNDTAKNILQKQSSFFSGIGSDKLTSGYTMSGSSFNDYLDTAFLSAYTAASQVDSASSFGQSMLSKLTSTSPSGYFGSSLRAITLFVIAGNS